MWMPIRRPTRKELIDLEVYDITDYKPWNPRLNETDEMTYLTSYEEDGVTYMECKAPI